MMTGDLKYNVCASEHDDHCVDKQKMTFGNIENDDGI